MAQRSAHGQSLGSRKTRHLQVPDQTNNPLVHRGPSYSLAADGNENRSSSVANTRHHAPLTKRPTRLDHEKGMMLRFVFGIGNCRSSLHGSLSVTTQYSKHQCVQGLPKEDDSLTCDLHSPLISLQAHPANDRHGTCVRIRQHPMRPCLEPQWPPFVRTRTDTFWSKRQGV
jgi:hypothetical protein